MNIDFRGAPCAPEINALIGMRTKTKTIFPVIPLAMVIAFCFVSQLTAKPPMPAKPDYLHDGAAILSTECEAELLPFLRRIERESGVELVVVTIDRIPPSNVGGFNVARKQNMSIEAYAKAMFNHYEIGNASPNQGVMLLVAKHDRKCRIELGAGYSTSTDQVAKRIIDRTIVPAFRSGDYQTGIRDGVTEIATSIAGMNFSVERQPSRSSAWILIPLGIFGFVGTLIFASLAINGKRGWGWVLVGLVYIQYLKIRNWFREPWPNAGRSTYGSSYESGNNFFDSGSSWSGDSFSSGGGFSDGGGASGDW